MPWPTVMSGKNARRAWLCGLSVLGSAASACGGDPATTGSDGSATAVDTNGSMSMPASTGPSEPTSTGEAENSTGATCDGYAVLEAYGCVGCHSSPAMGGLDLRLEGFAERLVGVPAQGPGCSGRKLIDPEDIAASQLLQVLSPPPPDSSCMVVMPPIGMPMLGDEDIACIAAWLQGFSADGPPPLPFEPVAIESALTKVKMLTVGTAPSVGELAAVTAEPGALRDLLKQWVETPEFERKTRDALAQMLQVAPRPSDWPQLDGANHAGTPAQLGDMLGESVVRTAWDLIAAGKPLTDIFTTRRWAVTTAELVVMRYTDQTTAEREALDHKLVPEPTLLGNSIKTGNWYLGDLIDPKKIIECRKNNDTYLDLEVPEILRLLWGHLRCRNVQDLRFYETAVMPRSGGDYNDWRFVEFTQADPDGPLAQPPFWDILHWRSVKGGDEVASRLPRVGFMTSPAFFNNWATNTDNRFRVTTNQTMIVALGASFRVGEPTPAPQDHPSIPLEHIDAPECLGCHRQMDPMRVWFQNSFGTRYQSVDDGLEAFTPNFAFGGVTAAGDGLDAFAGILAGHPTVATAWTQKLCRYANGEGCDSSDPEFQRVADVFATGFDYKALVVELFASPLVTGLAPSVTWAGRDLPVNLVRARHLCAALDHRNEADICADKTILEPLRLIPDDRFARAAVDADVPQKLTTFSLVALEDLCTNAADLLVKKGDYDPDDPDITIPRLVEELLGVPPGHSRHDPLVATLTAHYETVVQTYTTVEAMKSALILGCISPDTAGLGL